MAQNNNKQGFINYERYGRTLLKDFLGNCSISDKISNIQPTLLSDRLDMYCNWDNNTTITTLGFEIKVRDEKYLYENTLLMEKSKYEYMVWKKINNEISFGFYCNFFDIDSPFGKQRLLYMFEQETIRDFGTFTSIPCKNSTVNFSKYINKEVIMIPKEKALKYTYDFNTGKWN